MIFLEKSLAFELSSQSSSSDYCAPIGLNSPINVPSDASKLADFLISQSKIIALYHLMEV